MSKEWNKLVAFGDNLDLYRVFVGAKKNFVNQWSTKTLEDAELSIRLFKQENPSKDRSFARISKGKFGSKLEIIKEYAI